MDIDSPTTNNPEATTTYISDGSDDIPAAEQDANVSLPEHLDSPIPSDIDPRSQQCAEEELTVNRAHVSVVLRVELGDFLKVKGVDFHDRSTVKSIDPNGQVELMTDDGVSTSNHDNICLLNWSIDQSAHVFIGLNASKSGLWGPRASVCRQVGASEDAKSGHHTPSLEGQGRIRAESQSDTKHLRRRSGYHGLPDSSRDFDLAKVSRYASDANQLILI